MHRGLSRRRFLATVGATAAAATAGCTGLRGGSQADGSDGPPRTPFTVPLAYTLDELFDEALLLEYDPADPPDVGRYDAAIDEPSFVSADAAALSDTDVVFGVERNGEAKAYPQYILVWNEIVNDTLGGVPVCVTYCPLTGTAIGFERGDTSFGMSNKLVNSNLILYDRETQTWWPQMLGAGIANDLRGDALVEFPVVWTTWERWRRVYPETAVLSEDTGVIRDYGDDPYGTYDPEPHGFYASGDLPREVFHESDRFHPKEVVVGARTGDGVVAFVKETLRTKKTAATDVGGIPYAAFYDERFDSVWVYRNPDGETFEYDDGEYVDTDGYVFVADEIPLDAVNAFDAMWFAWYAYFPNTVVAADEHTFFG